MNEKIEFSRRKITPIRKVPTEFCFLCLKTSQKVISKAFHSTLVSLVCLRRHLKINLLEITGSAGEEVEVNLCDGCEKVIAKFSGLFLRLEKIKMEMDYELEKVKGRISSGINNTELVRNYTRSINKDIKVFPELAWIDKLRNEISKKCSKTQRDEFQTVELSQITLEEPKAVFVKQEIEEEVEEEELSSPPVSPDPPRMDIDSIPTDTTSTEPVSSSSDLSSFIPKAFIRDAKTLRVPCPSCPKTFSHPRIARAHYDGVHVNNMLKCDICNIAVFSHPNSLTTHKTRCRKTLQRRFAKQKAREKYNFACSTCGKRFRFNKNLQVHQSVHFSYTLLACELCNKKFKTGEGLKVHKESAHLKKTWNCRFCNKILGHVNSRWNHEQKCSQKDAIKMEASNEDNHLENDRGKGSMYILP